MVELFEMGPKHRPEMLSVSMTAEIRDEVIESLDAGFRRFLSGPGVFGYSNFCHAALEHLKQQLNTPRFADGVTFTNSDKPHEPGTRFVAWLSDYDDRMRLLHKDYVVTTADKLPNNYVVVCKKHYVLKVLQDLRSGQFYEEVQATPQQPDPKSGVCDNLLQKVKVVARAMYADCADDTDLLEQLSVIPYEAALVKLHKNPIALRFLACSGKNGLRQPAVWLTALFRCIHPDLVGKWCSTLERAGVDWCSEPPWYATRSKQVVDAVRKFNTLNMSDADFREGGGWHGYDVVRLYTNIDLQDLVTKLSEVLQWAWDSHVGRDVVLVYHDKFHGCEWLPNISVVYQRYGLPPQLPRARVENDRGMYSARCGKDPSKGKFYVFDLQHAVDVLRLLVENSYVYFAGQLFHQTRGIPMGINPAVYMANYYLFYYEFVFVKQLVDLVVAHKDLTGLEVPSKVKDLPVQSIMELLHESDPMVVNSPDCLELHGPAAMFLLHQFRCTVRFVDDFSSAPNPFTKRLLYCFVPNKPVSEYSVMGGVIKGIYPGQFLELEATPGDHLYCFSTLDVQIVTKKHSVMNAMGDIVCVVQSFTQLYDKRRNACYRGIPIVQYQHVSSTLSLHCGYNTLIGQLHRFRELIMLRDNFILEVARVVLRMQKRGYKKSILFRKLKHHLRIYPDTFGDCSFYALLNEITDMYECLCSLLDWETVTVEQVWAAGELEELLAANEILSDDLSDVAE